MRKQVSVETMVCSEYQRLLEESQGTLEIWHEHRAEICRSRLIGTKQATNSFDCKRSLLELTQVLQNHAHNCLRCQLASRTAGCSSQINSSALFESSLYGQY